MKTIKIIEKILTLGMTINIIFILCGLAISTFVDESQIEKIIAANEFVAKMAIILFSILYLFLLFTAVKIIIKEKLNPFIKVFLTILVPFLLSIIIAMIAGIYDYTCYNYFTSYGEITYNTILSEIFFKFLEVHTNSFFWFSFASLSSISVIGLSIFQIKKAKQKEEKQL